MNERWQPSVLGSSLTAMKVGGPVDWVSRPATQEELEADLRQAGEEGLPVRILGGGSNVLLPDVGLSGLVIIPSSKTREVLSNPSYPEQPITSEDVRYTRETNRADVLHLQTPEQATGELTWVRLGAGLPWGQAVLWTLEQQLTGLQWYARIPCNVGGALYNNIHGEKHFLSEVVQEITSYTTKGEWQRRLPSQLDFFYDHSIFHELPNEVIWEGVFRLERVSEAEAAAARTQYLDWTKHKTTVQPSGANCGSVFQNLTATEQEKAGAESAAAGWYVEQVGAKGWTEGDMQVFPGHANFIVNQGNGTQADFRILVQRIREAVNNQFGIWLTPEVECIEPDGSSVTW